jgi:hypothetical protein
MLHKRKTAQVNSHSLIPLDSSTPTGRQYIHDILYSKVRPIHTHSPMIALDQCRDTNRTKAGNE